MGNKIVRLIYVDSKFIKYLYRYDSHVMFNKGQKRPYIGVLFEIKGHKFYAPLTHPKEKYKTMKNDVDFMRIRGGELGAINFNNMIPVHEEAIIPIIISSIEDIKYKMLLINQIKFFDEHETEILNKAVKLYKSFKNGTLRTAVKDRCCNFPYLEKLAKKYDPDFQHNKK